MFSSVKARACLDISVAGPGTAATDLLAASKNIANDFSVCSRDFSARLRSSAGTSRFGCSTTGSPPLSRLLAFRLGTSAVATHEQRQINVHNGGFQNAALLAHRSTNIRVLIFR